MDPVIFILKILIVYTGIINNPPSPDGHSTGHSTGHK